jgi:hypothetical protein
MCSTIKRSLNLYICIFLALTSTSACIKFLKLQTQDERRNALFLVEDFRKTFLEAFFVTLGCFFVGYLLAGLPTQISWQKLLPTLLIAFPVYGTRFAAITWGGDGIGEQMDKLFFKTLYVVGITWLVWDICKGII